MSADINKVYRCDNEMVMCEKSENPKFTFCNFQVVRERRKLIGREIKKRKEFPCYFQTDDFWRKYNRLCCKSSHISQDRKADER